MSATHEFIAMSDGVRLSANLYFPEGDGPWPALLEALPYRKDDVTFSYRPEYVRLAENGYVMCRIDVRGTGSSEGRATDEYPVQEQRDLCEVIDWLATQEWSSGSVGMYGTSYSGFNSIQVAMERPPALKAIIPIFATDDRYADDVHYMGGALRQLDLIDYPTYMTALNALPPVPALAGPDWRAQWERRVRENEPWVITWLEHQRFDDYWQHGSLRPNYGAIEAATMIVAGWADGYRNNSLRTMAELRCPKRLLLGPWAHASVDSSNPGPNIDLVAEHLRWWDRWLKGADNGVDREPEIVVFVRHATVPEPNLEEMRGEWRFEPAWPAERMRETAYALADASGPPAGPGANDELRVRGDVGWTAWISCAGVLPWGQPDDQRPDEAFSLSYDWGALDEPLEIMGSARLEVTVTSSAPVAYLSAKLCDVFPDGTSALVTRGLLNLAHRDSREEPAPLTPGSPTGVVFDLEVASYVFDPGHTIRLDLAGTDWPNVAPPPEAVTLGIDRARSTLTLPVLNGPAPVSERPSLPPPRTSKDDDGIVAVPNASLGRTPDVGPDVDHAFTWRIEHDQLARETRAFAGSWDDVVFAEGPARTMKEIYGGVVAVSTTDPGASVAEGRARFEIEWPEATCVSEVRQTVQNNRDGYRVRIELETSENGEPRWSRTWERTIPRDLR